MIVILYFVFCCKQFRHGKDHKFNPTEVNYRANIDAMRQLGVTHILSATACGSLKVFVFLTKQYAYNWQNFIPT